MCGTMWSYFFLLKFAQNLTLDFKHASNTTGYAFNLLGHFCWLFSVGFVWFWFLVFGVFFFK